MGIDNCGNPEGQQGGMHQTAANESGRSGQSVLAAIGHALRKHINIVWPWGNGQGRCGQNKGV